jgi:hypothetical protein|tara:strand:- start:45 stop:440 length:396 start_codon:yes stop_codon:yes gene_type:complete
MDIGVRTRRNTIIIKIAKTKSLFSFLYLKNNIPNIEIVNIKPSYLIRQKIPARTNDNKINFFCELKKSARDDVTKNMKKGSVIPVNEFSIILGSKIKINGTSSARLFFTNFFARKYNGTLVKTEKITDRLR